MTLPRFEAICKHWERVPPLAITAAAIASRMGVAMHKATAKAHVQDEQEKTASRQGLFDMLAGGGSGINREVPEWLREAMK
jgi:hypothetical protein